MTAGGYALTPNVPADVARAWMDANQHSDMVRNHVIKICDDELEARAECIEYAEVRSGIERLDVGVTYQNNQQVQRDPRWPKRANGNLSTIEAADAR